MSVSFSPRPRFHFTPPANWLNDPNGLVYYRGEYHLFYQYHPDSLVWGPMHWGHAVSRDLLHWEHLPIALYPDEQGMIFSGSAVVDWHNTAGFGAEALVAIFTYNKNYRETQNLAFSQDQGRTWSKFSGNPVVTPPPETPDFRDPKVIWHQDHWVMVLAAGRRIMFFTAPDLKTWTYASAFGPGWGSTEGVWETPDLFPLSVDGRLRWVLTVGVGAGGPAGGSGTQYFIGDFDGHRFESENPPECILWMDYGPDFYAPQSWSDTADGRRLALAWMNNWVYARVTPATHWRGMFSLPRELRLVHAGAGVRLAQTFIPELDRHRALLYQTSDTILVPGSNGLAGLDAKAMDLIVDLSAGPQTTRVAWGVRVSPGTQTQIVWDRTTSTLSIDRTQSGVPADHSSFSAICSAPVPATDRLQLRILVDQHSVEILADEGQIALTASIFPAADASGLALVAQGDSIRIHSLALYSLRD